MKSTHLISSKAFFFLWCHARSSHNDWHPFFLATGKLCFLFPLPCVPLFLSLSAFNVSSIARHRNVYDAQFFCFSFHEKLHQAYGDVCHDWFQYGKLP